MKPSGTDSTQAPHSLQFIDAAGLFPYICPILEISKRCLLLPTAVEVALTVDVEDWFHVCALPQEPEFPPTSWRVMKNVEELLALFESHRARGTFFVLGSVAEAVPELVPLIRSCGHEIACHGYSHRLVPSLGPEGFREDLLRATEILTSQAGEPPTGYRAPQWSLSLESTSWALEILRAEGYLYDSSLTPLRFVGNPRGPLDPFAVQTESGEIWEIPPMVSPSFIGNLPTGGGWGFRFFPDSLIEHTIRNYNARGKAAVLFIHPREIDPEGPKLKLPPLRAFVVYGPPTGLSRRIGNIMARHRCGTMSELVQRCRPA